jgi:hypothetical protein
MEKTAVFMDNFLGVAQINKNIKEKQNIIFNVNFTHTSG